MYQVVEFGKDDVTEALTLWQECEHIGLGGSDNPSSISRFLDRNPGFSFVIRSGSVMAGAILCGHDARRGYIYHLAVVPRFR